MKRLLTEIRVSLVATLTLAVILCGFYPFCVWVLAQGFFPVQSNGSLLSRGGKVVGSSLIAQGFTDPKYFHPRPSAAGQGYDAAASGGSNLGPLSRKLVDTVRQRVEDYRTENRILPDVRVPADAVTGSASGLDPHVSVANARLQAGRVAAVRGWDEKRVLRLIQSYTEGRDLGVFGEPGVNVLRLNLALDAGAGIEPGVGAAMSRDKADAFLRAIRRSQRGRLKVYLGYCAGVGKTYQMLQEGHRLQAEGLDAVIGLLETHGRAEIARLAEGLEVVRRQKQEYRGIAVEEMDVDAILARKPQVALIDELAHTNVPGSRNAKRYEDVQDILDAGIHVITTLNVQHLESLYHTVEQAVRVRVRERLPDSVLAEADQIVDVDLTPEDLRKRLEEGRIYPRDRSPAALANFFQLSNLEKLRELALRELAAHIDLRRRDTPEDDGSAAPDQVMVCLSSRGPQRERLLRYASRLAGKLNRNWYAVYVQTRSEEAAVIDARTQNLISDTLTLAKQLGAMVFTYKGDDVAGTILRFAREYRVGHIVIGTPGRKPWWQRFGKNRDVLKRLIRDSRGINLIVLDTREEDSPTAGPPPGAAATPAGEGRRAGAPPDPLELSSLLSERRIQIWDESVRKEEVLRALAGVFRKEDGITDPGALFEALWKREQQGSTFFNEGAAFPHARLDDLEAPLIALGLARQGVSDVQTEKPIETVFLILTPAQTPDLQTQVLGLAARAGQNRQLLQGLRTAGTPEEAMRAIRRFGTES